MGIIKGMVGNIRLKNIQKQEKKLIGWNYNVNALSDQDGLVLHGQLLSHLQTFLPVQKKGSNYRRQVENKLVQPESDKPSKGKKVVKNAIEKFMKGGNYSQEINLRLVYDEFYSPKQIEKIDELRDAIHSQPAGYTGNVYVYQEMSPLEIFSMFVSKYFYIPSFFTATTDMHDLKSSDCPFSPFPMSNSEEFKRQHPEKTLFNVVFEINVDESDSMTYVNESNQAEKTNKTCLFPCYSHFEYVSNRLEKVNDNEIFIVTIKGANDKTHAAPFYDDRFKQWLIKRGELMRTKGVPNITTHNNFGVLCKSFERYHPEFEKAGKEIAIKLFDTQIRELEKIASLDNLDEISIREAILLIEDLYDFESVLNQGSQPTSRIAEINKCYSTILVKCGDIDSFISFYQGKCWNPTSGINKEITEQFLLLLLGQEDEDTNNPLYAKLTLLLSLLVPSDDLNKPVLGKILENVMATQLDHASIQQNKGQFSLSEQIKAFFDIKKNEEIYAQINELFNQMPKN